MGGISGTIENVGFRSTRIRTFDKSLVTLPNKKMVDVELDNLGMRDSRRVKFNIGLTYETSTEQMKAIVTDIQDTNRKMDGGKEICAVCHKQFPLKSILIHINGSNRKKSKDNK